MNLEVTIFHSVFCETNQYEAPTVACVLLSTETELKFLIRPMSGAASVLGSYKMDAK